MKRILLVCLIVSSLATTFSCVFCERAWAENPPANEQGLSLDFRDVELSDLVRTMSEMTGRNFLFDDTLKGKVTIISPRPMSPDEAYRVFLSVLNVKGFTVVPSGAVYKIVATRDAKENTLPTQIGRGGGGDQYVTRLIPLEHVDATSLVTTVLTPLVPKTSHIVAYPPSNTLIITDTAANIDRLARIIRELDVESSSLSMEILFLKHGSATEVAQIATQFLEQGGGASVRRGRTPGAAAGGAQGKVLPYARTNSLVVMATAEDLAVVRRLVEELDRSPDQGQASLHVYYLEYASAEALAKTLNEITTGTRQQRGKKPGQDATQAVTLEAVTVTADLPTNSLVVNATPEEYAALETIIRRLDIPRKQVFVEALILELSMDATSALGVSLQGAGGVGNDGVVFGTSNLNSGPAGLGALTPLDDSSSVPSLLGQSINGILAGGLFNPITVTGLDGQQITVPAFSVLIDASKQDSDINILSAPRLLATDNEEAEIVVGSNVPIITQRLTDPGGTSGLTQSVAVERQDVALILRFTPQVTEGERVRLSVFQEITDIAESSVGDIDQVGPTLTKRLLRNTVIAENGRTVVLGGLIGSATRETVRKVPLLGDIPILGWLFKRRSVTEIKRNLLVFITPHIVRDADGLADVTRRSEMFMQRFRAEMSFPIEDSPLMQDLRDGTLDNAAGKPAEEPVDLTAAPEEKSE